MFNTLLYFIVLQFLNRKTNLQHTNLLLIDHWDVKKNKQKLIKLIYCTWLQYPEVLYVLWASLDSLEYPEHAALLADQDLGCVAGVLLPAQPQRRPRYVGLAVRLDTVPVRRWHHALQLFQEPVTGTRTLHLTSRIGNINSRDSSSISESIAGSNLESAGYFLPLTAAASL